MYMSAIYRLTKNSAFRWAISTLLTVGTTLFAIGRWTGNLNATVKADHEVVLKHEKRLNELGELKELIYDVRVTQDRDRQWLQRELDQIHADLREK